MAQNVTIAGRQYSAVPAIDVPKTGGGTATFTDVTDTTATAADVATGKYFYLADGTKTQGTSSGGGGRGAVTQDQDGYLVLDDEGGGGGASNIVTGTFTTGSTEGTAETVNIPYTGNGFPLSVSIWVSEGVKNSSGTAYSTLHRYAIMGASILKINTNAPTYGSVDSNGKAVAMYIYKSSATVAGTISVTSSTDQGIVNATAWSSRGGAIQISSSSSLSVYISSTSYGLLASTEYCYCIQYSE